MADNRRNHARISPTFEIIKFADGEIYSFRKTYLLSLKEGFHIWREPKTGRRVGISVVDHFWIFTSLRSDHQVLLSLRDKPFEKGARR